MMTCSRAPLFPSAFRDGVHTHFSFLANGQHQVRRPECIRSRKCVLDRWHLPLKVGRCMASYCWLCFSHSAYRPLVANPKKLQVLYTVADAGFCGLLSRENISKRERLAALLVVKYSRRTQSAVMRMTSTFTLQYKAVELLALLIVVVYQQYCLVGRSRKVYYWVDKAALTLTKKTSHPSIFVATRRKRAGCWYKKSCSLYSMYKARRTSNTNKEC